MTRFFEFVKKEDFHLVWRSDNHAPDHRVCLLELRQKRWATVVAIVLILFIGVSRFVLGAHYPTDVLTGWLFGLISVAIVHALDKRVSNNLVLYGILLVSIIPGFFYCRTTDYYDTAGLLIGFMGGLLLDEHYVHFENTRKPIKMILRMVGGFAIFLVLNTALKMPFSKEFLESRTTTAMLTRCIRYAVISFVVYGLYPMLFDLEKRFGKRACKARENAAGA